MQFYQSAKCIHKLCLDYIQLCSDVLCRLCDLLSQVPLQLVEVRQLPELLLAQVEYRARIDMRLGCIFRLLLNNQQLPTIEQRSIRPIGVTVNHNNVHIGSGEMYPSFCNSRAHFTFTIPIAASALWLVMAAESCDGRDGPDMVNFHLVLDDDSARILARSSQ